MDAERLARIVVPFQQWTRDQQVGGLDPTLNREPSSHAYIQHRRRRDANIGVNAVETEGLPDFTRTKGQIAVRRPVISIDCVGRGSVAFPPTDQTGGWLNTMRRGNR